MNVFYIDKNQAKRVFDALIARLVQKGPPYSTAFVPQADVFLPKNLVKGSREHAIFLFVLCLWMRGGVESDTAAFFLKIMHESTPEIFNPSRFKNEGKRKTKSQVAYVTKTLTKYRLNQRAEENALAWVYNMRKLDRFWQGDPRKLMDDQPDFSVLIKRIMGKTANKNGFINDDNSNGFRFFREKMTAMIAYFLMDGGLVPLFYGPVPVDFHVLRLLTTNLVIRVEGKSVEEAIGVDFMRACVLKLAREVTEWYCRENKVSMVALCDTLWLLSRTLCRKYPGNSGYVVDIKRQTASALKRKKQSVSGYPNWFEGEKQEGLPEDEKGRKRYKGLKWTEKQLSHPLKIRRIEQSCGICPVEHFCRYRISSGAYYVGGKLLLEGLRPQLPGSQSDFLSHEDFTGSFSTGPIDPTMRFAKVYVEEA